MTFTSIQNSYVAGEVSPELFGRTDLAKYKNGTSTMRNMFVNYRGGSSSRAGLAYVGMCKQGAPNVGGVGSIDNPPRDIPFQFNINQGYALEFGKNYLRIKSQGAYVIEPTKNVTNVTHANPAVITVASHGFSIGDWVFFQNISGLSDLNGLTWVVKTVPTANTFTLTNLFGDVFATLNSSFYISGGTVARIYTVTAPYAAEDLPYLKYTQSADTMSLTCVNQVTGTEYPPYDLQRQGPSTWVFTQTVFTANISPPAGLTVAANASTTVSTWYSYVVTTISASGEESVASNSGNVENNDIAVYAGSNVLTWNAIPGAASYNVYKATPSYAAIVPTGSSYGYIGTAFGTQFVDTNITADFTDVPPVHNDPFARSTISSITITASGSGYDQSTVSYVLTSATGTGFIGEPVVVNGAVVAFIVENGGQNYAPTNTIAITGGVGTGATASLVVGPATGTYPGVVNYYQQRRVYANTINNPDTYYMSKPGSYKNFDSSIPTTDSDSITGTPWAQQVNGIQFMQPMTTSLIILTGSGAWSLNGGNNAAITPSDQDATAQSYNGCSAIVPPIVVNYDILYVQAKGSITRDLSYNFFVNIFTGTDMTVLSSHLFTDHTIQQWAYCEEPYKLIWCVREDGILLCLTYLKEQDVYGWSRHDTNGLFVSVCSVTEPPVDALYTIVKRYIRGQYVYYAERMDDRNWPNVEDCFCVDAGLSYPMQSPDATLVASAADGTNNITSVDLINSGSGYTNPTITVSDPVNLGSGASFVATLSAGMISSITPVTQGQNYSQGSSLIISDPTGTGVIAQPIVTNNVTFTTSSAVFSAANVGDVLRMGGGQAIITSYISATQVVANIIQPITQVLPNNPGMMPVPFVSGLWTLSTPTMVVSNLNHLEGLTVAILADGSVIPNQVVVNGQIELPQAYSAIVIGLPYLCQIQTLYLDTSDQPTTAQGKRKNIYSITSRVAASRGFSVGANQPDSSVQANNAVVPWANMSEVKQRNASINAGNSIPLFTGDAFQNIQANWNEYGQVATEQPYPLPLNLLAQIVWYITGDTSA